MKLHNGFVLSAVILASLPALAEAQKPDPKVLATSEAIIAYCAKADPSSVEKYKDSVELITKGVSDDTLAKVRKSDEYRQAKESMDDFLGKVDARNAPKVCSRDLAQGK